MRFCEISLKSPPPHLKSKAVRTALLKIGSNPLAGFMSRIATHTKLSKMYTNHCTCVTGCTFLARNNFYANQIMSVNGHHSLNSLAIYQKVSDDEKMVMGMSMNYFMNTDHLQINAPPQGNPLKLCPIAPKHTGEIPAALGGPPQEKRSFPSDMNYTINVQKIKNPIPNNMELVLKSPHMPLSPMLNIENQMPDIPNNAEPEDLLVDTNFDLMEFILDVQNDTEEISFSTQQKAKMSDHQVCTTMRSVQYTMKTSPNLPMFNNCKISEIHFHIEKK